MTVKLNTKGLDKIASLIKKSDLKIRVGILGSNASQKHTDSELTNAQIGRAHEFGTSVLPIRSFLRMPLTTKLPKALAGAGGFNKDMLRKMLKDGTFKPFLDKIGAASLGVVLEAFDTGGYGQWPPSDMSRKKNAQTLIETGQLRNSVTWELVKRDD